MSPTPMAVNVFFADILAHLAEMALDRHPAATRGDGHGLVVIPHRAAGGERIAQPEAIIG
jgi:hypothetical protein